MPPPKLPPAKKRHDSLGNLTAIEVEKATLTAAVMSTSGGMGKEMDMLVRQIATNLSVKRGERYSDTV